MVTQTFQPINCPNGADVSGGGGAIAGPSESSFLNESYPVDGEGWRVEATSTSGARTLTGYAICDSARPTGVATFQTPLAGFSYGSYGATCGGSSQVLGGRVGATGPGIEIIESQPDKPTSWEVGARNFTVDDTLLDAYVICGNSEGVKFRESEPEPVAAGNRGKAMANCKADEALMGGGFRTFGSGGLEPPVPAKSMRPVDSGDKKKVPDDGFQVKVANDSMDKVKLVTIAVCRKP